MKWFSLFVMFLFIAACGSQQQTVIKSKSTTLDSQLEDLTDQIVLTLSQQQKSKIAVIEFSNLDGKITEFGRFIAEELITRLYMTNQFDVIERQMLNKVMNEHSLNLSGMIDESSAKELGRILGVDAICTGSITDLGESVKINARLISTETGKLFSVASVNIIKDDVVRKLMDSPIDNTDIVQTEQGKNNPDDNPSSTRIVEEEGFRIELKECTLSNRRVVCHLIITNTSEDDKDFEITYGWQYQTKIFDDLGNEYIISAVKFANQLKTIKGLSQYDSANKKIVAGTSVSAELIFDKVSSMAVKINLLQILCGFRGFKVEFRDIDLIKG
ncbi:MAG: hypothetical protein JW956_13465 [Calditrichaceae bacterium]|nr:hypothetical protein [Calditrichaceae bacterium]